MPHWLEHTSWLGISSMQWIITAIAVVVGYIVVYGAAKIIAARCKTLAAHRPDRPIRQVVAAATAATRGWIILLLAITIGLQTLLLHGTMTWLVWIATALIGIQCALWLSMAIVSWFNRATPEGGMQQTNSVIFGLVTWAVELMVWSTLLLFLLSRAGQPIGPLLASLGVGGIAIALAAKNVLEDLFASLAIGLDKPFTVGEFIAFGSGLGTVKKVGIKSTRLESLSGEELAINNSNLLQNLVHNYSRRQERRIVFGFHLALNTPVDKVEEATQAVNAIIDAQDNTRRDRGFIEAIELEGFRYEFVYYVLTPDYADYVTAHQAINLKILARLEAINVRFAMPARRVYGDAQGMDKSVASEA